MVLSRGSFRSSRLGNNPTFPSPLAFFILAPLGEAPLRKTRVLVANRPRLMRELIRATIADQPDIEVVGEIRDDAEILPAVDLMQPDFLIITLDESDQRPIICDFVLERHPQVKILAIAPDRNSSIFYWASLHIRSSQIDPSEEGVLNALRGKVHIVGR